MPCKVYKHAKPINEKIKRAYKKEVRKIQDWCNENSYNLYSYSTACNYDICVTSQNEYDLGELRKNIAEDNGSYFLTEEDYEEWVKANE